MSIVKMKHVRLLGMAEDREPLLKELRALGCVEIRQPDAPPEGWALGDGDGLDRVNDQASSLRDALDILHRQGAEKKKGLFSPRPTVSAQEFFDEDAYREALDLAARVENNQRELNGLLAQKAKVEGRREQLAPWLDIAVPLTQTGTRDTAIFFAYVPKRTDRLAVTAALDGVTELYTLSWAGEDKENRCFLLICHNSVKSEVQSALLALGGGKVAWNYPGGTARDNDVALKAELDAIQSKIDACQGALKADAEHQDALRRALDRAHQDGALEKAKSRLLDSRSTFYLDGWAPAAKEAVIREGLSKYELVLEFADPRSEEYPEVPIQLKGNRVTAAMNPITEMYSMPAYGSVDPNPLMAPFFIFFFGFMMNDIAYGLLMVIGTALFLKLAKPKEGTRNMMTLFFLCGLGSIFWGCLTGSFFGDFFPQLFKLLDPSSTFVWFWPPLFSPVSDTILVMIGSMALGAIQVFTGMAINVVETFRKGDPLDAVFNEISWWIVIGAAVGMILGGGMIATVLLVVGLLMLVVGGTRKDKGFFGKAAGAIGIVYNGVSGFFSDILSYLRLMALMMAGSIIAQVFNTLGSVFGLVPFIIVALIGNILNLVLNLLGCYVHTLRLQCLEFFGRFYKDGGKLFKPLAVDTNYVDIQGGKVK